MPSYNKTDLLLLRSKLIKTPIHYFALCAVHKKRGRRPKGRRSCFTKTNCEKNEVFTSMAINVGCQFR
jgi:hypothetical protein